MIFLSDRRGIDGPPVHLTRRGDVLRRFQATFDLEAGHTEADQLRYLFHRGEVLRREQIPAVAKVFERAIHDEFVWQPAGLRAFAAIRAALAESFAGQALAGVRDAQRAVEEGFE